MSTDTMLDTDIMPAGSQSGTRQTLSSLRDAGTRLDMPRRAKESKADRRARRRAERLTESRRLESWERYRALADHIDHLLDVIELADRKTRFALVILGALNAVNLLVAVRADTLGIVGWNPAFIQLYVSCYVLLSLYFLVHAISALKPRARQMSCATAAGTAARLPGLRLMDDMLGTDVDSYCERWRDVEIGDLNREMAVQAYLMARTNAAKFLALHRVYRGLFILVGLTAALVAIIDLQMLALPGY